jgi:hypothetical protein
VNLRKDFYCFHFFTRWKTFADCENFLRLHFHRRFLLLVFHSLSWLREYPDTGKLETFSIRKSPTWNMCGQSRWHQSHQNVISCELQSCSYRSKLVSRRPAWTWICRSMRTVVNFSSSWCTSFASFDQDNISIIHRHTFLNYFFDVPISWARVNANHCFTLSGFEFDLFTNELVNFIHAEHCGLSSVKGLQIAVAPFNVARTTIIAFFTSQQGRNLAIALIKTSNWPMRSKTMLNSFSSSSSCSPLVF